MQVFVARQPIFERDKKVHGYELLFRSGSSSAGYDASDADRSTLEVISHSLDSIGLDNLVAGKKGFINFTRNLLLSDVPMLLPSNTVTVEVLEDVNPDREIIDAIGRLKAAGFTVAMDDFIISHLDSPLVGMADIVKVDFMGTTAEDRSRIAECMNKNNVLLLAEKVETNTDFEDALAMGYHFFQGYFFSKPIIQAGKQIKGNKLSYLRILTEINNPDFSYDNLEEYFRPDVVLTYKLLRFINSVWFGLKHEVSSIKHALVLLGPREIKKWLSLVAMSSLADDKPTELILGSLVRARSCEALSQLVGQEAHASDLFLMGMFSFIDALTDVPMADVIKNLPINAQIKQALVGEACDFRNVLEIVICCERADWPGLSKKIEQLALPEDAVAETYNCSLAWANQAFNSL